MICFVVLYEMPCSSVVSFPVVFDQLCTHCGWDVGLLLHADLVWRPARTLQDLLCVSGHCHAGRPNHEPSLLSLGWGCCPVLVAEKHPQSMMFPPHASPLGRCSWDCPHPSSSKHGEWKLKHNISILWSHDHMNFSHAHPDAHWQTSDGPGHVLLQQGFDPCWYSVLLMATFENVVPALFGSLTRCSCVDLGWFFLTKLFASCPEGH